MSGWPGRELLNVVDCDTTCTSGKRDGSTRFSTCRSFNAYYKLCTVVQMIQSKTMHNHTSTIPNGNPGGKFS